MGDYLIETGKKQKGVLSKYLYMFDNETRSRKVYADYNNDGKYDSMSMFYEDSDGNTIREKYDKDFDGKYDKASIFSYDDKGNLQTRYDAEVTYHKDNKGNEYSFEDYNTYTTFKTDKKGNSVKVNTQKLSGWKKMMVQKQNADIEDNYNLLKRLKKSR